MEKNEDQNEDYQSQIILKMNEAQNNQNQIIKGNKDRISILVETDDDDLKNNKNEIDNEDEDNIPNDEAND